MAKLDRFIIDDMTYEIVPEIALLFDATKSYAAGDCVIKDAVLYRFTTAHAAGAWTGNDVVAFEVGKELTDLKADLQGLSNFLISVDGPTLIINTELVDGNEVSY